MPDIDLDIPDNKRDEILNYVHDKYGHSHVSQIITFGTLAAKQALRDVGRVFGMAPYEINDLSKLVPNVLKITLKEALKQSQKLQNWIADSSKINYCSKLPNKLKDSKTLFNTCGWCCVERPKFK